MGILKLEHVSFSYDQNTYVLHDINLSFDFGKVYGIFGKSGAGKTTLLSLLAGLEVCKEGNVFYNDFDLKKIPLDYYRSHEIGIVFQNYHLLAHLTALENVVLSMDISRIRQKDKKKRAYQLLKELGIEKEKADRLVLQLSGGEQQRVSLARALANDPGIILADEPTGNLDEQTEKDMIRFLTDLAHKRNKCVILISHSDLVGCAVDCCYVCNGGKIHKKKG